MIQGLPNAHTASDPFVLPMQMAAVMRMAVSNVSIEPDLQTPAFPDSLSGKGSEAGRASTSKTAQTEAAYNVLPPQWSLGPETALSRALAGPGARHRAVAKENSLAMALLAMNTRSEEKLWANVIKLPDYAAISPRDTLLSFSETG